MIEDFAKLIPDSLMKKSGSVFFSGRTAFSKPNPSGMYILGINPGGGDPGGTRESFISSHVKDILKKKCADWSAYRDDHWGFAPGKHFLQRNVLHLLSEVKAEPHEVPASEVVFLRSKGVGGLIKFFGKSYEELADECWPFHKAVIDKLGVRVVVCYGKPSGEYVRGRLDAHRLVNKFAVPVGEKGKFRTSYTYRNEAGLTVVTLWFPGIGHPSWRNPDADPTGLVVKALAG